MLIWANEEIVLRLDNFAGGVLTFDFANPGKGNPVEIVIDLPDAISPQELGLSIDGRVLGLGLTHMVFQEKN